MANRRMFSLKVIDTDEFLDMPQTTQLLYYNLAMRADDDGFIGNPKKIMRISGCGDDDMKVLIAKRFVIPFESGICVIRHWRIHNYIQSDRYCETEYLEEKKKLLINNGKYEPKNKCIQDVSKTDTQVRLGKVRLGKSKDIYTAKQVGGIDISNKIERLTDYFIKIKNLGDVRRERYFKTAKELLVLANDDLLVAKEKLDKLKEWAEGNGLEYEMETCIKRWIEL